MASALIGVLKNIQNSKLFTQYTGELPFPDLPSLSDCEIKQLLSKLATGKALSYDLFSDIILKDETTLNKLSTILKDLWSKDLNKIESLNELFKARLVALNKVHPKTPKPDEFRPIIILSLIVKIMECRWLPKLQDYVITKLCASQTGFVPGQGVFTNIFRAIKRIKERTNNKKNIFGFFIDFKSAYNYTRHDLLFERLEKVLGKEEIDFQKAIYNRLIIQSEDSNFRPNLGVAQGSVISPSLFDIYTEPLLRELNEILGIQFEDILAYADDILILCENKSLLNKCIDIVEEWSQKNNLKINKSKSGIIEFRHRRNRKTVLETGQTFREYPILDKYKYLGTWLSNKIELDPQLQFINNKVNFMKSKLNPCLYNASLEFRKNLWQVFVVPLFEFILPIYSSEEARTKKEDAEKILRRSFKSFTGLGKNVETDLINELMGYNLNERSKHVKYVSEKKWEARKMGKKYSPQCDPDKQFAIMPNKPNKCKYFSKEMIKYINLQTVQCPKCKQAEYQPRCSSKHLDTIHHVKIDSVNTILDRLNQTSKKEVVNKKNRKVKKCKNRIEMVQNFKDILDPNYRKLKQFLCSN